MTEYIEREAVFEKCGWYNLYSGGSVCAVSKKEVAEIPAADVVEVVHGHWISQQEAETINDYGKAYCCSICGHCDWDCTESESFNYCPHCGAKMDGKRRSE